MVRLIIFGGVIAVAFTLFAVVDAAMTDGSRARGVSKPVWVVLIVLLPVIGAALWFIIGKGATPAVRPKAPDDDPRFTGTKMSSGALDEHMKDLEDRLRELDDEVFPGESNGLSEPEPGASPQSSGSRTADSDPAKSPLTDSDNSGDGDAEATSDGDSGAAQK